MGILFYLIFFAKNHSVWISTLLARQKPWQLWWDHQFPPHRCWPLRPQAWLIFFPPWRWDLSVLGLVLFTYAKLTKLFGSAGCSFCSWLLSQLQALVKYLYFFSFAQMASSPCGAEPVPPSSPQIRAVGSVPSYSGSFFRGSSIYEVSQPCGFSSNVSVHKYTCSYYCISPN